MRGEREGGGHSFGCFNPRPAVRPGDAAHLPIDRTSTCCFNPRPAVRPGDALQCLRTIASFCASFNPRPAVRPGDAAAGLGVGQVGGVSIRARP